MKTLALETIDAAVRLRTVDAAHAEVIAASIKGIGLTSPISVRPLKDGTYRLIAGAHRLEALKRLGRDSLEVGREVIIREDCGEIPARIEEIDENLARHELSALDRALFLAERKKLYEAAHPGTKHGGDRKPLKNAALKGCIFSLAVPHRGQAGMALPRSSAFEPKKRRAPAAVRRGWI